MKLACVSASGNLHGTGIVIWFSLIDSLVDSDM